MAIQRITSGPSVRTVGAGDPMAPIRAGNKAVQAFSGLDKAANAKQAKIDAFNRSESRLNATVETARIERETQTDIVEVGQGTPETGQGYAEEAVRRREQRYQEAIERVGNDPDARAISKHVTGAAATRSNSITGLKPEFRDAFGRMMRDAPKSVRDNVKIFSSFRDPKLQAKLYANALKKYGSEKAARKWVAPPGKSQHNHGTAMDLRYGTDEAKQWMHRNAAKYGLNYRMSHEPWHIELAPGGVKPAAAGGHSHANPAAPSIQGVVSGGKGYTQVVMSHGCRAGNGKGRRLQGQRRDGNDLRGF